jgi:hypothetical protein
VEIINDLGAEAAIHEIVDRETRALDTQDVALLSYRASSNEPPP